MGALPSSVRGWMPIASAERPSACGLPTRCWRISRVLRHWGSNAAHAHAVASLPSQAGLQPLLAQPAAHL